MRCWRRVCAAAVAVAAFISCVFVMAGVASAGEDEDAQTMLFSGRDLWRNGAFAYGGFVYAPGGLDQDGLLLKILLSGGLYRYDATNLGGERVIGTEWLAQVLPGGGSSAAMPNSNSLWVRTFRSTGSSPTTQTINFAAVRSACGWQPNCGTSPRPTR